MHFYPPVNEGKKCISSHISGFTLGIRRHCKAYLSLAWCGIWICITVSSKDCASVNL